MLNCTALPLHLSRLGALAFCVYGTSYVSVGCIGEVCASSNGRFRASCISVFGALGLLGFEPLGLRFYFFPLAFVLGPLALLLFGALAGSVFRPLK